MELLPTKEKYSDVKWLMPGIWSYTHKFTKDSKDINSEHWESHANRKHSVVLLKGARWKSQALWPGRSRSLELLCLIIIHV